MADISAEERALKLLTAGGITPLHEWIAAAITEAVEAERAAILDWAKGYRTQILANPRKGEFMNGLESAAGTVVKAIETRASAPMED